MRESILTIPINEIFEPKCGCPICEMKNILEKRTVEYIMGAAMMEPDVRIETNRLGFCKDHYDLMLKQKNRLSLALMLSTHLNELEQNIFSKKFLESRKGKLKKVSKVNSDCFVCEKVDWGMERLLKNLFDMYHSTNEFKNLFREQEYICVPHYELLMTKAEESLNKNSLSLFKKDCDKLVLNYLHELKGDVEHFCSMYDYRNTGKDSDWGNSRDSIERAINFLTSK